jgi:hypothetical protein
MDGGTEEAMPIPQIPGRWAAMVSGTILLIAGILIFRASFPAETPTGGLDYIRLSAIVLIGLALTVVFMAILAIIFKLLGIENGDQPLGLPEGSIRALLAFSLVLIFVCLAAFLFSSVKNKGCENCGKTLAAVNDAQLSDLKTNFVVAAEQAKDDKGKPLYEQIPDPKDPTGKATIDDLKHPLYNVTYYPKQATDATDFAKQIFTTLATVFVSVVSFYFGSSVTASAVRAGATAAQGTDADKKSVALQTALTNALAESHNAQAAVDHATENLAKAQADLSTDSENRTKQAAVEAATKALADAKKNLQDQQANVQAAQNAVNAAKAKGTDSATGQTTP